MIITHTETPRALRGRGIASELVKGALELIRADGRKVIAGCGFVVDYLRKNPQFADLTADQSALRIRHRAVIFRRCVHSIWARIEYQPCFAASQ